MGILFRQKFLLKTIVLYFFLLLPFQALCTETKTYRDKQDFFIAEPPLNWQVKEYPSENIWQKVSFHHPNNKNIYIFVACGPVPSEDYSLEDLWNENQQKIKQFKKQHPSGKFVYKKDIIAEMNVHVFNIEILPGLKQRIVTTIIGNTVYSLTFKADSKTNFSKNEALFKVFYNSFIPLKSQEIYSKKQIKAAMVARYKILAELSIQLNQTENAIFYIEKGLAVDQYNQELLELKSSVQ